MENLGSNEDLVAIARKMPTGGASKRIKLNPVAKKPQQYFNVNQLVLNLSNEFAFVYTLSNICDKSHDSKDFTSYKLRTHTLYLQTSTECFELSL